MSSSAISTPTFQAKVTNLTDSNNQSFAQFMPAGAVLPFAGSAAPTGYILCDGRALSKTTYAGLYAAIGDVYATQFNEVTGANWAAPSGTEFRLPDYRGSFLRGVGTPTGKDAVTLGARQEDTMQGHRHLLLQSNSSSAFGGASPAIGNTVATGNGTNVGTPFDDGTNGTPRTGNETRPMNKGVNYIIKT